MIQPFPVRPVQDPPASPGSGRSINPLVSIRKHWQIAAAVAAFVAVAGLPIAWMKGKPQYKAEGVLYVSPRFLPNLDSDEEHQLQSNSQYREFMQQQVRTVNRFDILAGVLKHPDMAQSWKIGNESDRRAVERLQSALQIAPVADTYQITVGIDGPDAKGLAEIVNTAMAEYIRVSGKELLWDSDGRLEKLNQEKEDLDAQIAILIERKTQMSGQLGTTVFNEGIVNTFDKRLASAIEALEEARRQRFAAEGAVSPQAAIGTVATAMDKALGDSGLSSFKATLNQRKASLLTAIHGLSPQHAGRIAAEKELKEIEAEIARSTDQVHKGLQTGLQDIQRARYEQAQQLEKKLQQEVDRLRSQVQMFSHGYQNTLEIGEEISRLRKRRNATEDRINFLSLETRAPGFVRVFSPAMTPEIPFKGGRKQLFALVLAAALALGLGAPLAIDFLDPRIMTGRELEALLSLPVCGVLDAAGWQAEGTRRLAVILNRNRTQLTSNAIVISGVSRSVDSTAIAMAAARSLAALGRRALVIEYKPAVRDLRYRSRQSPGLIDLLGGHAGLLDCIIPADGVLPDRIAVGAAVDDRSLLRAELLEDVLAKAAHQYDLILIDVAPASESLATEEAIRIAGAVLLCVAGEKDKKAELAATMTLLERIQPRTFGAVIQMNTGMPLAKAKNKQSKDENDTSSLLAA